MRIIGFSKEWPKLKQEEFTTFRLPRKDRDWWLHELVKVVLNPRSPKRRELGAARIIDKYYRVAPIYEQRHGVIPFPVFTGEEAKADGFDDASGMEFWLIETHGEERVANSDISKITLRWEDRINDNPQEAL